MGLRLDGLHTQLTSATIALQVNQTHAYIQLANALNWLAMYEIIAKDLKKSTRLMKWWVGRPLDVRTHLGVLILQTLTKMTDRQTEESITANAVYQVFCGRTIIENWHCPDHTKIEKFRNRLTPSTQQQLVCYVVSVAKDKGFADPSKMDVDSTVQEVAMSYPADASLLTKLAYKCKKILPFIKDILPTAAALDIDLKSIKKTAKEYFFMGKNKAKEIKYKAFEKLYTTINQEIIPTVQACMELSAQELRATPWNIRRALEQIRNHAQKYLTDVAHFIKTHTLKAGKILSFQYLEVACISKGKVGKDREFGRVYQLGRIGGNFLIVLPSTSVRQDDKSSLVPMVKHHQKIFGEGVLQSMGTDKGYYTKDNIKTLQSIIPELGIQCPCNAKQQQPIAQDLKDRRAGIEPLIGHVKKFGLGKSKAKSDQTTLASGYRSVLGFNLHQLARQLSRRTTT
jgi:hypothetical protein